MFETDQITESGRMALVGILNKSIEVEYRFIVNCPRIIDQLVNIDKISDDQLITDLDRLGKDSLQHASWTERAVTLLGGEPQLRVAPIDRIVDIPALLQDQLEREKAARTMYQEAKRVAEQSQVKGIGAKIKSKLGIEKGGLARRGEIMNMFEQLATDELAHIDLAQGIIARFNLLKGRSA